MNEAQKFWIAFWITMLSGTVALAVVMACYFYSVNLAAFENGYERTQLNGTTCTSWQKAELITVDPEKLTKIKN